MTVLLFCAGSGEDLDPLSTRLIPARRVVPADRTALDASLQQLFVGVTSSEATAGLWSIGGPYLASTYVQTVVERGVATIELRAGFQWQNNLSTATASALAYRQIESNVFAFDEIEGLEYVVDGRRWCGFENVCDGVPNPLVTRGAIEPPAPRKCLRAWDKRSPAPSECEAYPEAFKAFTSHEPSDPAGRSFVITNVLLGGERSPAFATQRLHIRFTDDRFEVETPCGSVSGRFAVYLEDLFVREVAVGGFDDCNDTNFEETRKVQRLVSSRPRVHVTDEGTLVIQRHADRVEAR